MKKFNLIVDHRDVKHIAALAAKLKRDWKWRALNKQQRAWLANQKPKRKKKKNDDVL